MRSRGSRRSRTERICRKARESRLRTWRLLAAVSEAGARGYERIPVSAIDGTPLSAMRSAGIGGERRGGPALTESPSKRNRK